MVRVMAYADAIKPLLDSVPLALYLIDGPMVAYAVSNCSLINSINLATEPEENNVHYL